jgi:hypothetical protein
MGPSRAQQSSSNPGERELPGGGYSPANGEDGRDTENSQIFNWSLTWQILVMAGREL